MITLPHSARTWGTADFEATFKAEVEALKAEQLPLQQGLSLSSYVSAEPFRVMVIGSAEVGTHIEVKAGIFYSGIIAGCSCADDPSPTDVQAEYCEVSFAIDKTDGHTTLSLLAN